MNQSITGSPGGPAGLSKRILAALVLCILGLSAQAHRITDRIFPLDSPFTFTYDGINYEGYIGVNGDGEADCSLSVAEGDYSGDLSFPEFIWLLAPNPRYSEEYNPDVPETEWVEAYVRYLCDFSGNENITSITLPPHIYDAGMTMSFDGCSNLRSVSMTMTRNFRIMPSFRNCTSLSSVSVYRNDLIDGPDGEMTPFSYSCGDFTGCTSLGSIEFPEGMDYIGDFSGCTSLEFVRFSDGIRSIDLSAFDNCPSLTSIGLPSTVDHINFICTSWDRGTYDPLLEKDSFGGFSIDPANPNPYFYQEGGALIKVAECVGDTVHAIDPVLVRMYPCFSHDLVKCEPYGTLNRYYYKVPSIVKKIADRALWNVGFSNLWIGDNVEEVGWLAFEPRYFSSRSSVIVGENVRKLKFPSFYAPDELIFLGPTPPEGADINGKESTIFNGTVNYVFPDALEAYKALDDTGAKDIRPIDRWTDLACDYRVDYETGKAAVEDVRSPWSTDEINFKESVVLFGHEFPVTSCASYLNAESVYFHKNFEKIEIDGGGNVGAINVDPANRYFRSFDGVLYYVGDGTYDRPEALYAWPGRKAGDCVIREGTRYARLDGAAKISSLDIPASLDSIYMGGTICDSLEHINFPSLDKWFRLKGQHPAYQDNRGSRSGITYACGYEPVERVLIPAGDDMRPGLFYRCTTLVEAVYNGVGAGSRVADFAFAYCSNLRAVSLGDGLEEIGNSAFRYCGALESMKLPHSVRRLGKEAFYGDTVLSVLSLSPAIRRLEGSTAGLCRNLRTFIVPEGVDSIGRYEISGTDMKLELISLPSTLKSLGEPGRGVNYPAFPNIKEGVEVYCWASVPPAAEFEKLAGVTVHVPVGSAPLYAEAAGWNTADEIVDDLLVENTADSGEDAIVIRVPAAAGDPALEPTRYEVDLYILSDDGTKTFVRRYEFDNLGYPMSRAAAAETDGVTLSIDGLASGTTYCYELRGYTDNNDLVLSRDGEAATRVTTGIDAVVAETGLIYSGGKLYLPSDMVGARAAFYSTDGRLVLETVCETTAIDLHSMLAPGIYVYKIAAFGGKVKID